MKNKHLKLGKKAEKIAANYLKKQGLKIIDRNFRTRAGEIDLIAKKGDIFIFVEVKSKKGYGYGSPEEMVDRRKQRKIIRTAELYLYNILAEEADWRIDVVTVRPKPHSKNIYRVSWINNAVSR